MPSVTTAVEPEPIVVDSTRTAMVMIEALGDDVSLRKVWSALA